MRHPDNVTRTNQSLTALTRVNQAILRIRNNRRQLLEEVCSILHDEMAYEVIWVGERALEPNGNDEFHLLQRVCQGDSHRLPDGMPEVRTAAAAAVRKREPIITRVRCPKTEIFEASSWTVAALPIMADGAANYVLAVCSSTSPSFSPEELRSLSALTGDLGFALETMGLEQRRRRAEEALRMSEERFRRLAEHSLSGIVLIQHNLYRYVNRAFARMFGYDPSEIIDKLGPLDLTAPESHDVVAENMKKRLLGQIRSARYRYVGLRQDGTRFDVEEYGARTVHAQRLGIVATVLDVTAQEASRRRLEALSQAGLVLSTAQTPQQALEKAVDEVMRIVPGDAASIMLVETQGLRLVAKAGDKDLQGSLIGEQMKHHVWLEKIKESGEPVILDDIQALDPPPSAAPSSTQSIVEAREQEGRRVRAYAGIPLIVRGEVLGVLNIESARAAQFTEKDAQHLRLFADHVAATLQHLRLIASLEEERNRLRTLNELSHTLSETLELQEVASRGLRHISRAVHADRSILYLWTPEIGALTAVAAEGVQTSRLPDLNARLHDPETATAVGTVVQDPGARLIADTGAVAEWCPVPGVDEGIRSALNLPLETRGEIIGVLSFLSEERAAFGASDADLAGALAVPVALAIQNARFYEEAAQQAEVLAEALRRQAELDRMKDELIQNISHELRTPLALIMGYAELLEGGRLGEVPESQATAVHVITRRSRMLRSMVEDIALLWSAETEKETREPLDLVELVTTTVHEFRSQAMERHLTLNATTPDHRVILNGAPVQLRRVLDNLIGNALKFTPPQGRVDVSLKTDGERAELVVVDTGIGVPEDQLSRIFDRFYQVDGSTRRKYGGTGLGLALVRAIVEAHNGKVVAVSPVTDDPDRPGTRIRVELPLMQGLEARSRKKISREIISNEGAAEEGISQANA